MAAVSDHWNWLFLLSLVFISIQTTSADLQLPTVTKNDLLSLKVGAKATRSALLNAISTAITSKRCISAVDPQLLEMELPSIETTDLEGFLIKNNQQRSTQICPELLVPFEHEEMWFLAWFQTGNLHFLADEDLINQPIGQKVLKLVEMLYPGQTVRPSKPKGCVKSDANRGRGQNSGVFVWYQVASIVRNQDTPKTICNGGLMAELSPISAISVMRHLEMLRYPKETERIISDLPEKFYGDAAIDQVFMIKPKGTLNTRTFSNGNWSEEVDLFESYIGKKLLKCGRTLDCRAVVERKSVSEKSSVRADGIFVDQKNDDDLSASWFCAHSGVLLTLTSGYRSMWDTPEFKANQTVFMCKKMPLLYSFILRTYLTETISEDQVGNTVVDFDRDWPAFSKTTSFKVMLQPHKEPKHPLMHFVIDVDIPGINDYRVVDTDSVVYEKLAAATGETFMVKTRGAEFKNRMSWLSDSGTVLNVISSVHPWFADLDDLDNSILAYNVPSDKTAGPFWVCLGDVSIASESGGVYCLKDEDLNRELRCASVVGPIVKEDPEGEQEFIVLDFNDVVYEQLYSDCPRAVKRDVLEGVKEALENLEKYDSDRNRQLYRTIESPYANDKAGDSRFHHIEL